MDVQAVWLNFRDAVVNHYFDFHGRIGRAQFWYFALANFVFSILASILQGMTWLPVAALFHLAMLLPSAGMGARRLQDTGRDGRLVWLLVLLVAATQIVGVLTAMAFALNGFFGLIFAPGLGIAGAATLVVAVVLIYFWVQPGDAHDNAYGPPPPVFDPSRRVPSPP
jgi:uncharacterized membrane protein YhaH (DUF805 family)